jgi:hypothetical protein
MSECNSQTHIPNLVPPTEIWGSCPCGLRVSQETRLTHLSLLFLILAVQSGVLVPLMCIACFLASASLAYGMAFPLPCSKVDLASSLF